MDLPRNCASARRNRLIASSGTCLLWRASLERPWRRSPAPALNSPRRICTSATRLRACALKIADFARFASDEHRVGILGRARRDRRLRRGFPPEGRGDRAASRHQDRAAESALVASSIACACCPAHARSRTRSAIGCVARPRGPAIRRAGDVTFFLRLRHRSPEASQALRMLPLAAPGPRTGLRALAPRNPLSRRESRRALVYRRRAADGQWNAGLARHCGTGTRQIRDASRKRARRRARWRNRNTRRLPINLSDRTQGA